MVAIRTGLVAQLQRALIGRGDRHQVADARRAAELAQHMGRKRRSAGIDGFLDQHLVVQADAVIARTASGDGVLGDWEGDHESGD